MNNSITIEGGELAVAPANAQGVRSFKGIPYAAAPVGDLRWHAPQPILPWKGVRPSDKFGANSLQGILFSDIDPFAAGVSEDCLYCNVWTPADLSAGEKLPVLFWIHGGGFVAGSGGEPRYDGTKLTERGIVVVTINHRLNALGFLAHPAFTAEGCSGNFGMLDLVAGLKWVARNIGQFGGDPECVTIAGESAGSMAVSGLMASPQTKGLFARAIGQSGGLFAAPTEPAKSLPQAEENGLHFAEKLGAKTLAQLRALPAQAILEAAPGLGYRPIIDGQFLPQTPAEIFAKGLQNDVPLMAGWNKDEGFNFNVLKWGDGKQTLAKWVNTFFGQRSAEAFKFYPDGREQSVRDLGGDLVINLGTWQWLEAQKKTGKADVFRYRFDRGPVTPEGWLGPGDNSNAGAFHSSEIPYVFDNLDAFPWLTDKHDQTVATRIANYWVNFITAGNPNGTGLPQWPSNRNADGATLFIDIRTSVHADPDRTRYAFLSTVFPT